MLFSPVRDEDATETHLRRVIKKLHSFSFAVRACRNGVLYGTTVNEQRETRTVLIRQKVIEAYELHNEKKIKLCS